MTILRISTISTLIALLTACSSAPVESTFSLQPGRRAVLTLMPTTEEILLMNRGPGVVQMDLEDTSLRIFSAITFRSGDRQTFTENSLARIRFANDSQQPALIEFRIWGGGEEGFTIDHSPPPIEIPADEEE